MSNYAVYMHKNKVNGKIYIGQAESCTRRWRSKGIEYKKSNFVFWNDIQKYGWDNFEHIILEDCLTRADAQQKEIEYIAKFDTRNPERGYNIAEGGTSGRWYVDHPKGMKGHHHTEENRKKASERAKQMNKEGKLGSSLWKNGHPRGMKGHRHSQEYIERLKAIPSDEHPSAKRVTVAYPDGRTEQYGCLKYASEHLGIHNTTLIKVIKSKTPYVLNPHCQTNRENLSKIDGARVFYTDDTEVTE